jgi:hypothetical protein
MPAMNVNHYIRKQNERRMDLIRHTPKDTASSYEKAIWNIELIICDIKPYSLDWRLGKVKSLKLAIKLLNEEMKNHEKSKATRKD